MCSEKDNPVTSEPFSINNYNILSLTDANDPYYFDYILSLSVTQPADEQNIMLFQYKGSNYYHPVNMSNRILNYLDAYKKTRNEGYLSRSEVYANKLISLSVEYKKASYLPYYFTINAHGSADHIMEAPWYSGMAQGVALSVFVRLYKITNDEKYLNFAHKLFASFKNYQKDQTIWTVFIDKDGYYWIEEYPAPVPGRVLNGFIFAIFGLYDYYDLTRNPVCKLYLNASLTTIEKYFEQFRNPGELGSYCLKHKHIDKHYHFIHIDQLTALYNITGDEFFQQAAEELYNDYHE